MNQIQIVERGFWPWSKLKVTWLTVDESRRAATMVACDTGESVDEVLRILNVTALGYAAARTIHQRRSTRLMDMKRERQAEADALAEVVKAASLKNLQEATV